MPAILEERYMDVDGVAAPDLSQAESRPGPA
jgi:hypothetical protein